LTALDKSANLHAILPDSAATVANINKASFAGLGAGCLAFELAGDIAVPLDRIPRLMERR
jgi:hypothetical protein